MEMLTAKINLTSLIPVRPTNVLKVPNTLALINITVFLARLFAMAKRIVLTNQMKLIAPALIPCVYRRSFFAHKVVCVFLLLGYVTEIRIVNMVKMRTVESAIA